MGSVRARGDGVCLLPASARSVPDDPPQELTLSRKRVHRLESAADLAAWRKRLPAEARIHLVLWNDRREACERSIGRAGTVERVDGFAILSEGERKWKIPTDRAWDCY